MAASGKWRRAGWIAAGGVVLLGVVSALRPDRVEVELGTVTRGPLEVTVQAQGHTRVKDRFVVAAPFSGRLERVTLEAGDDVAEGDVVARLRPLALDPVVEVQARSALESSQARQRAAQAQRESAEAALAEARRNVERTRALAEAGSVSRQSLDEAELAVTRAEQAVASAVAQRRAAEAEVSAARARIDEGTGGSGDAQEVPTPSGGRVLRVWEEGPGPVAAGTPLVEVGDVRTMEVVLDVLSTDAVRIPREAPVRVVEWGGPGELRARVRRVEPSARTKVSALGVEEQRVWVVAGLEEIPPRLGDRYRVEGQVIVWSGEDVLRVPTSALFRRGGEWAVLVEQEGVARERTVRVGHQSAEAAQVVEGLQAGERVILHPPDAVEEGTRVRAATGR